MDVCLFKEYLFIKFILFILYLMFNFLYDKKVYVIFIFSFLIQNLIKSIYYNLDIMAIVQVILFVVFGYGVLMLSGFHKVREGYVGIYKNFGVLQKGLY
jgi:hypothetical protein